MYNYLVMLVFCMHVINNINALLGGTEVYTMLDDFG